MLHRHWPDAAMTVMLKGTSTCFVMSIHSIINIDDERAYAQGFVCLNECVKPQAERERVVMYCVTLMR